MIDNVIQFPDIKPLLHFSDPFKIQLDHTWVFFQCQKYDMLKAGIPSFGTRCLLLAMGW